MARAVSEDGTLPTDFFLRSLLSLDSPAQSHVRLSLFLRLTHYCTTRGFHGEGSRDMILLISTEVHEGYP